MRRERKGGERFSSKVGNYSITMREFGEFCAMSRGEVNKQQGNCTAERSLR